jgi:tetratricopeptide (TPR) repeat protein
MPSVAPALPPSVASALLAAGVPAPVVNSRQIINESFHFLKDREPEMTEAEYALYEKIVPMVSVQPEYALQLLETMVKGSEPVSAAFEFALANVYYMNNRQEMALPHYQNAVKRYPDFLRAWGNMGLIFFASERYPEAVTALSKAVSLGDKESRTLGLLAYSLFKTGNLVASEMAYLQALSTDPENTDWMEGLLGIYFDGKQLGRAENLVQHLVRIKPGDARNWILYADILIAQSRKLEAISILEIASNIKVLDSQGLLLLGDLYAEQKLMPEAIDIYSKVVVSAPNLGIKRMVTYAQSFIGQEDFAAAGKVINSIAQPVPRELRSSVLQAKADLLSAQKKWPEARKLLQDLLSQEPLNGQALLAMGRTYSEEGDNARATFEFEQAIKISDAAYRASIELANLAVKAKRYEQAVEYLQKALSIEKSPAVQEFLVRIRTLVTQHENQ